MLIRDYIVWITKDIWLATILNLVLPLSPKCLDLNSLQVNGFVLLLGIKLLTFSSHGQRIRGREGFISLRSLRTDHYADAVGSIERR